MRRRRLFGFTIVELMLVIGLVGVLVTIALPRYADYREKMKVADAIRDIGIIAAKLSVYGMDKQHYPETLTEIGWTTPDPWGNPYQYLAMEGASVGKKRKDRSLHPLNSDFDLYSMGPDGRSVPPLTAKASEDDIIRANDGRFIGKASEY
ncbi:prepilin-type cleavage/methylation domain-containing protein [uncultured Pseudacidovorax sp.]|uniref:type IV pilin protein n=1 Tax=uncultured Pseudacidovorax sp. TaxID=679313 RepID=UPI0025D36D13|nr:prepilin-type cleavage/methylation domain-containing protein [uncultured Pseudacidovorax sp.]